MATFGPAMGRKGLAYFDETPWARYTAGDGILAEIITAPA
jgi:hypothetical protein